MKSSPSSSLRASFQTFKGLIKFTKTSQTISKKASKGFQALKKLEQLIHPPLPLSPRDGQRLLGEITGSFRRQLAASSVLPILHDDGAEQMSAKSNGKQVIINPADEHFRRLLGTNMLHGWPNEGGISINGTNEDNTRIQRILSCPLEVLEDHIWSGTATPALTTSCLRIYVNQVVAHMNKSTSAQSTIIPKQDGALIVLHLLRTSGLLPKIGPPIQDRDLTNWLVAALLISTKPSIPFSWVNHSLANKDFMQAGQLFWAILQAYSKIYDGKKAIELFLYVLGHKSDNLQHTRISQRINPVVLLDLQQEVRAQLLHRDLSFLCQIAHRLYERTTDEITRKELVAAIDLWSPGETALRAYLVLKHFHDPYPGLDYLLASKDAKLSSVDKSIVETRTMLALQLAQEFYKKEQSELAEEVIRLVNISYNTLNNNIREKRIKLSAMLDELAKTARMDNIWLLNRETVPL